MTLKSRIHAEYVSAFKNREGVKKNLLGVLRAEITTIEKNTRVTDLSDAEITKLLLKYKKNLAETRAHSNDPDLVLEESVIESFLPTQMQEDEIQDCVIEIIASLPTGLNLNALAGKTIGEFNKRYPGQANPKEVMKIINTIAANCELL